MFQSHKWLRKRTTPKDLNRPDYLQALVTEFQETQDKEAKDQILANLASFAYDPINYPYLRDLHVLDLFVDCIETDEDVNGNIVQFGIGGLCNAVADLTNRQQVLENPRSIELIIRCLSSAAEETVLSAITTLIQLVDDSCMHRIVTKPVIESMKRFAAMSNPRFKNLAQIFLEDYCQSRERANTSGAGNSGSF